METSFFKENETLLFFFLVVILLVRPFWNLVVWNKIYNTKYTPASGSFQRAESNAKFYCFLIFWWLSKKDDTRTVRKVKWIGNWISVLSTILSATALYFFAR